jgi:hypothetical protein
MNSKAFTLTANLILMLALSACGLAPAPTPMPRIVTVLITATFEPTATPSPTNTLAPTGTSTPRPSPTPNLAATEAYTKQQALIGKFYDAGYITTRDWRYSRVSTFSDEWAKLNWYEWKPVGVKTSADFIIRTDISWESASNTPEDSGCGFVFRKQANDDHYVVYISMNGTIRAAHNLNKRWTEMGVAHYGEGSLNGSHNFTLLVKGNTFTVLVDDNLVKKYTGFKDKLADGDLDYTVVSGTNKGFGTRCTFTNTQVWTNLNIGGSAG